MTEWTVHVCKPNDIVVVAIYLFPPCSWRYASSYTFDRGPVLGPVSEIGILTLASANIIR